MSSPPALYRALLREASKFSNYNVREYIKRRSREGFVANRHLQDEKQLEQAVQFGKQQLEIAKRQAVIYNLYASRVKSIMDLDVATA